MSLSAYTHTLERSDIYRDREGRKQLRGGERERLRKWGSRGEGKAAV